MYQANQLFGIKPWEYDSMDGVVLDAFFIINKMQGRAGTINSNRQEFYRQRGISI